MEFILILFSVITLAIIFRFWIQRQRVLYRRKKDHEDYEAGFEHGLQDLFKQSNTVSYNRGWDEGQKLRAKPSDT